MADNEATPVKHALQIDSLARMYAMHKSSGDKIDTTEVMGYLAQELIFKTIGHEDQSPLGMYLPGEGIYTTSEKRIESIIMQMAPELSARQIKEVYQKIEWQASFSDSVELTKDKNLIPVQNGIFDVKNHKLLDFDSKYIFTSKIATPFDPKAKEPELGPDKWKPSEWLNDIANGDKDVNTLLWQVIHASINGSFSYRKSIWLLGKGNDGKGTFQQLIMGLVGMKNTAALKINDFSQRFAMSQLVGKTVVIGDDVPAGVYLDDSSNFNAVVTGDVVQVEQKNKQPYTIQLTPTVIQSTNEMPKFKNTTNGTNRRLIIVPFNKQFSGSNDNWRIKDEYVSDPAVSKWVLKNALLNYDFEKFIEPDVVKTQLEIFKEDNNPLSNFKNEVFDKYDPDIIPTAALHKYYVAYNRDTGQRNTMAPKTFTKRFYELIKDDYEKKRFRVKDTSWAFEGLYPRDVTQSDIDGFTGNVNCFVKYPQINIPD